ncbi:MAG: hypothetical protein WD847_06935 [Pirellulales bacterium]
MPVANFLKIAASNCGDSTRVTHFAVSAMAVFESFEVSQQIQHPPFGPAKHEVRRDKAYARPVIPIVRVGAKHPLEEIAISLG